MVKHLSNYIYHFFNQLVIIMKIDQIKTLALFFLSILVLGACNDDEEATNLISIEEYLEENNLTSTAIKDASGLYYIIETEGTGDSPTLSDSITVTYTGKLTDNRVFDFATDPVTFKLSGLIEGWQVGFQLLKEGSKATLFIPSSLAYGTTGIPGTVIGPNTDLIFDVELIEVK